MNKKLKVTLQCLFLASLIIGTFFVVQRRRANMEAERELQPGTKVEANGYLKNEGSIFGTIYHITYQNEKDLKPEIEQAMQAVDRSLSMFNKESVVSKINDNSSNETDSLFRHVFAISKIVSASTGGCFDPTVAPLVNAWGFGFKNDDLPSKQQVDSLLSLIGFDHVAIRNRKIMKTNPGIVMDFSAVAKGFAVDQVARLLEQKGIKNYMVEIGGEVIVKGQNPKGSAWRVGIAKPTEAGGKDAGTSTGDGEFQTILELHDKAMATSGNYRNYYVTEDGRKLAHTIDPHTGYPVQHSILSSTVFAPDCATADAYATAFMVMGLDEAKKVLKTQRNLEVYFIYADEQGKLQVFSTIKK